MSKEILNPADLIASDLVHIMCAARGLNEFLENALPPVTRAFGADRVMLIDYRDNTKRFDLMHFGGYDKQSRFDLQRGLPFMELDKAFSQTTAYFADGNRKRLYVPLYFSTTLEALIVFESDAELELTTQRVEIAKIVSKFLGLLMSSSRLGINRNGLVDLNDLQRARQIQLTYLPPENLETDRYEVYGYNRSSSIIGGDYFDYFRIREGSIQCVLADASGHGLSAALIMSTFRGLLHAEIGEGHHCDELFTTLNRTIHCSNVVQYLTGVFMDFDEKRNCLSYTNAGHFDPAVVRGSGSIERLTGGGPPLGMFKNSSYPSGQADVHAGDLLVLFTDGITDLRNARDEFFGEDRILQSVWKHRSHSLKEIASQVLDEGITFSATQPEDDLTLFLMRFR